MMEYEQQFISDPLDINFRITYLKEKIRTNEVPVLYLEWLANAHNIHIKWPCSIIKLNALSDYTHTDLRFSYLHDRNITTHNSLINLKGFISPHVVKLDIVGDEKRTFSINYLEYLQLPNLQMLDISQNKLSNINSLSKTSFSKLTHLNISGNKIRSLKPIHVFKDLKYLTCHCDQLESLEGLEELNKLISIDISSHIFTISGVKHALDKLSVSKERRKQLHKMMFLSSSRDRRFLSEI